MRTTRNGTRMRGLFLASLMVSAVIGAPVARAQLIYPYSPSEDKAANEVKEGLEAAKKAHLEAIDEHKAYLQEAIKRQRQLIAERELAQRDAAIAEILEAQDQRDKPMEELRSQIDNRLSAITGIPVKSISRFAAPGQVSLIDRAGDIDRARISYDPWAARLKRQITAFQKGGGKGEYCKENGLPVPQMTVRGTSGDSFEGILLACERMKMWTDEPQNALTGFPPEAAALLGQPVPVASLGSGEIREALEQSAAIAELQTAQAALAKAAKGHLAELEEYYQCQVKLAGDSTPSAQVQSAAANIRAFIAGLESLSEKDFTAGGGQAATTEETETCTDSASGKVLPKPKPVRGPADLLASAGLTSEQIDEAANRARQVAPVRSLIASVQEEAQAFKSSKLSDLLDAVAGTGAEAGAEPDKGQAASLLRMLDNIDQIRRARAGTLPDTSAVLVRMASARMKMATARIEGERLKQVKELTDLKVAALRRETLDLLRAYQLAHSPGKGALERGLMRYSDSWGGGRMPARVLQSDLRNVEYVAWADRERVAIEAAYAVLEPAVAELQIYGAGGLKVSEIAGLLHAIGLGAIAWGN